MYSKYKCFGCGETFRSGEIIAICPICRGKGVKIKEDSKVSEEKRWRRAILKAKQFVEEIERKEIKNELFYLRKGTGIS